MPTQDPESYGMDQATASVLTDAYRYREICDDDRIPVYFWGLWNSIKGKYVAQLRVEETDQNFDPMVSRYFESEYTGDRSSSSSESGGSHEGRSSSGNSQTVYAQPETVVEDWNEEYSPEISETLALTGRTRETVKNGTRSMHRVGDPSKNFQKDAPGSSDTISRNFSENDNSSASHETERQDDYADATKNRQANKVAPQTVAKIPRQTVEGEGSAAVIRNNSLGALPFDYASAYQENDSESGHTGTGSETGSEEREGSKSGNSGETHSYSRNQQTGTDINETESFSGYGEKVTESGGETRTRSGKENKTGHKSVTTTRSNSEIKDLSSASVDITRDGQSSEQMAELNRNRYTGREGMTPQSALESAMRYLQTSSPAIKWLIKEMECTLVCVFDL